LEHLGLILAGVTTVLAILGLEHMFIAGLQEWCLAAQPLGKTGIWAESLNHSRPPQPLVDLRLNQQSPLNLRQTLALARYHFH
jgi:hypothetical protein